MSLPNAILANAFPTLGLGAVYGGFFAISRSVSENFGIPAEAMNKTLSRSSFVAGAIFGIGAGILEAVLKVPNNVKAVTIIGYSILATMTVVALLHFPSSKPTCFGALFGTMIYGAKFYYAVRQLP
jgi:hypothetical protein